MHWQRCVQLVLACRVGSSARHTRCSECEIRGAFLMSALSAFLLIMGDAWHMGQAT